MNSKTYTEARAKNVPALIAYHWATTPDTPELDWDNDRAEIEQDGFLVRLRIELDDYTDLSWLGEFTDDPTDAVPNPEYGHGSYRYFRPTRTTEERREEYSRLGWAKGPADQQARLDVEQDARMAVDYCEHYISARAYRDEIELGSAGLGGVGFSDDYRERMTYLNQIAFELIPEAIEEARTALGKLCNA
jgi:hypothetical protein